MTKIVARFSPANNAFMNFAEMELLRSQTMLPPTKKAELRPSIATYIEKLFRVASLYPAKTPARWRDRQLDADYMDMRLRIVHRLQTDTVSNAENISPSECESRMVELDEFLKKMKR